MATSISSLLIASVCFGLGMAQIVYFSDADKQSTVDSHNQYRIAAQATAMQKMKWNDQLAQFAQNTASKCAFEHTTFDSRQNVAGFSFIGENIYTIAGPNVQQPTMKASIDDWASEQSDFSLSDNSCKSMCGHYTQIVWAATTDVGCAIANCPAVHGFNELPGYVVFCNYGVGGNIIGQKPYEMASTSADAGSKCQATFKNSADSSGLCDGPPNDDGQSVTDEPLTDPNADTATDAYYYTYYQYNYNYKTY